MSRPAPGNRRSTKSEYIETVSLDQTRSHKIHSPDTPPQDTGNKISRKAHIEGKPNIMLGGRTVIMAGVTMRGDLQRKQERPADGSESAAADKVSSTAITIGR